MNRLLKLTLSAVLTYSGYRSIQEFYQLSPLSGAWLGKFSPIWGFVFTLFTLFILLLLLGLLLYIWNPGRYTRVKGSVIGWRRRLSWFNTVIAGVSVFIPVYLLLYTRYGAYFTGAYMRVLLLLVTSVVAAIAITRSETELATAQNFFLVSLLTGSVYIISVNLSTVTSYPFSLSWSEGNRFYDYSSVFGDYLYSHQGPVSIPYKSTGRYMLWGLPFLVPDTPIWLHRLWDRLLWTLPYLFLGYLLTRWNTLGAKHKLIFTLWVFLFLTQGPVYTPLILSAILVVLLVRPGKYFLSLVGITIASVYAASSRFTWFPAVPTWSAILLLSEFNLAEDEKWPRTIRRLAPVALLALTGLAVGVITTPEIGFSQESSADIPFSQSLLWFRLLPNATFSQGILLAILTATIPLLVLLAGSLVLRIWKLNWLQMLAYAGAVLAFMAIGLVISVKIGGGSNLHNFDMYFVTLALLTGIFLQDADITLPASWPAWLKGFLALVIFLPVMNAVRVGTPLVLPSHQVVQSSLESIQSEVQRALDEGEVLFSDQRQLLTFGYMEDVPLVTEYEKKYLMEMAMANNLAYFRSFYDDLENKRFSLIVINPLHRTKQDELSGFAAENNAWVKWVARPVLCYYKPLKTFEEVRVQLLVPRPDPHRCPDYIFEE